LFQTAMTGVPRRVSSATSSSSKGPPAVVGGHDQAQVGAVEDAARLLDAQGAEVALVVHAGGVDEHHGAERQQFHRLLDRVGGGAGHFRDDGHLLAHQRVEQ
jgi:L-ascorbate metabolism protein UlaG (beta-lactamase superfamily)